MSRHFGTVDIMGIDILGIDIMGVDILGIDIPAPTPINRCYQLLVCGHNGSSNVSWISEEADFIERIYPVGSSVHPNIS